MDAESIALSLIWFGGVLFVLLLALMIFWLGEWHGHRHPQVQIPPRPMVCPFCEGPLRSVLVWSSVCRACNRGQVGPFTTETRTGWKEAKTPPFISHVDVPARHASDSPGGYPWKGL